MDSTLIQCECIDELARRHGVGDEIADITRRAMLGELDFESSLQARVARLAGLDAAVLDELAAELPITEGAARLVRGVRARGGQAAVVSGGFTFATTALALRLGLDHAHANTLGIAHGRLTGTLDGPVVGPQRKAALVDELAAAAGVPLHRVVAIGDGANDLLMLDRAGLGVAFHAKPRVATAADTALTAGGLDRVLYLLGWRRAEIDAL
jgi:phosphoserine phosphatase